MLPTCGMTVLWESLNAKSEQCTSRLLKFAAHRNPGRCEERSRTRCGGAVPSAAPPYAHFRIRELISPGAGSLGRRWHSAEPLSGNYLQLRRDVSPKVMFPLWGWLPPMTTRCRGKNTQPLILIWDNSTGPFQLQNSQQDQWRPFQRPHGSSVSLLV